jgi:hypothetical protein
MRVATAAFIALLGSLPWSGAPAALAATPAGGQFRLYGTPDLSKNGASGTVVLAGAIGDFGTYLEVDRDGTPDSNGNFLRVTLKKGGFVVDITKVIAAGSKVVPTINKATCSAYASASAPATLLKGTGHYTGIAGNLKVTDAFALVWHTFATGARKGQCDSTGNAQPIAQYGSIEGVGTVSFR